MRAVSFVLNSVIVLVSLIDEVYLGLGLSLSNFGFVKIFWLAVFSGYSRNIKFFLHNKICSAVLALGFFSGFFSRSAKK